MTLLDYGFLNCILLVISIVPRNLMNCFDFDKKRLFFHFPVFGEGG